MDSVQRVRENGCSFTHPSEMRKTFTTVLPAAQRTEEPISATLARLDQFFSRTTTNMTPERESKFLALLNDHAPSEEVLRNTCQLLEVVLKSFPNDFEVKKLVSKILIQNHENCTSISDLCRELINLCVVSVRYAKAKKTVKATLTFNEQRYGISIINSITSI